MIRTAVLLALIVVGAVKAEPVKTLVAQARTELWPGPKTKGKAVGTLEQGLEVVLTGQKKGKMLQVKTQEPFEIEGWVRADSLGCRLQRDTSLMEKPKEDTPLPGDPLLRKGAMVRTLKQKAGWMQVESAPYPVRIFNFEAGKDAQMTSEIVYTGYVLTGWIKADACSAEEKAYYDSTPDEGTLSGFKDKGNLYGQRPAADTDEPDGKAKLPGEALKFARWVELEADGRWSRGYVDGPVRIEGWVDREGLGPLPNTNPLNVIFMKQLKDYEIIVTTDLLAQGPKKKVLASLPGGTEVYKLGVDYDGCIVKTPPPISVEGLVDCKGLRNLGYLPEKVIDETKKQPQVTFPERGPKVRKTTKQKDQKGKKKEKK
jgi:hypothetical protein